MPKRTVRADARDNRARILTAARSAFDDLGPEANLREIARRAGLAQGTVHRHFATKQALFSAIAVDRVQDLAALARSLGSDAPAGEALLSFLSTTVDQARHDRSLPAVFAGAGDSPDVQAAQQAMNAELGALLDQAQADGTIRRDIDLADVHAITTAVLALNLHAADGDDARVKRVAVVLDGLRPAAPVGDTSAKSKRH